MNAPAIHRNILRHLHNVEKKMEECFCDLHAGQLLLQVDGDLPNGKHVRILKNRWMYHVSIDNFPNEHSEFPPACSEQEAVIKILHAMRSD